MYSFVSTNDFGHKTGYVSSITHPSDGMSEEYYPLEQIYLFDDLFVRFQSEIEHAHSKNTYFNSGWLKVCGVLSNNVQSSSYFFVRVGVDTNGDIRVYYGWGGEYPTNPDYYECTKSQYQNHEYQYTYGRIYLLNEIIVNSSTGQPNGYERYLIKFGVCAINIGTWYEPSSTWPYGHMYYQLTDKRTLPEFLPVGSIEQCGYPSNNTVVRSMQPEAGVTQMIGSGGSSRTSFYRLCSAAGEYDPDPDPPGPTPPGPGPTPSSDPNFDPNIEPGDNPNPSPGPHNRTYDPVPIPGLPTVTAVGAGFTTLYRPSEAILRLLASELYSDNAIQIISNFFSDPYDMIAGLSIVPFMVPVSGRAKHRIGLFESNIAMDVISNQFVTVNCGDILIEPYYNSFLDHSPYTRLILWLPYIGYQEIDPDEIMGQMLNITYHCDCLSGACTAFVNSGVVGETGPQIPRVIAQFSGNCSVQIPTAAASYDNLIASSINILTTAVSAGVGQVSAAASMATMQSDSYTQEDLDAVHAKSAVSGGQSLIGCAGDVVRAMKPTVTRNGTPGSAAGYMGVQKPYLIKIVPRNSIPDDNAFMSIKGYPSNKTGTLSEYSGFCVVEDIQLNNVPATIGEINEIYDLLKGGVIL